MSEKSIQRSYIPGDKWVYYKIYCGINTADSLLVNTIAPIGEQLIKENVIDQWFFIRYADPDQHLRIRFHLNDTAFIGKVMEAIRISLDSYIKNQLVRDLQIGTYHREMERYGENTIEELESYFYHDTKVIIKIIQESNTEEIRFERVLTFLDQIIDVFIPNLETKLAFLERLQQSYKSEFQINNFGKKALGKKYRSFKSNSSIIPLEIDLSPFKATHKILDTLHKEGQLQVPLENLLASIIHMHVNRVFQSRQRLYEMVLYDFLHQKTRSDFYKKKKEER
jgi:thiopeptide-type bacteriocin biosynthesis protein